MGVHVVVICGEPTAALRAAAADVLLGAHEAGATVRMRTVVSGAAFDDIAPHPGTGFERLASPVLAPATLDDLAWAQGIAFGLDGFLGNVPAPLKEFLDSTVPLWADHQLEDKVVTTFGGSPQPSSETARHTLYQTIYHWGSLVMTGVPDAATYARNTCAERRCAGSKAGRARGPSLARAIGRRLGELAARSAQHHAVPVP
jgi:NAD(P)H dehydrogenase (quinone)